MGLFFENICMYMWRVYSLFVFLLLLHFKVAFEMRMMTNAAHLGPVVIRRKPKAGGGVSETNKCEGQGVGLPSIFSSTCFFFFFYCFSFSRSSFFLLRYYLPCSAAVVLYLLEACQ